MLHSCVKQNICHSASQHYARHEIYSLWKLARTKLMYTGKQGTIIVFGEQKFTKVAAIPLSILQYHCAPNSCTT